MPTTALLTEQAEPHEFAVLYAAWLANADNQNMVKIESTTSITLGLAATRVRSYLGARAR